MSQEAQEIVVEMDLRDVLSIPNLIGVNQNVLRGVSSSTADKYLYGKTHKILELAIVYVDIYFGLCLMTT